MDPKALLAVQKIEPEQSRGSLHLWPFILLVLVLLTVSVIFLGQQPSNNVPTPMPTDVTASHEPRVYVVSYRFGVFSPTNLRIRVGDTVRWHNDSPVPIRVVSQMQAEQKVPEFDSVGLIQPDSYFSYTFATTGVFGYYNPSNANESGGIIVRE